MFLLPLALLAMTGSIPPETPDSLPPTPPPIRVKVEIIEIDFTPQDSAALGKEDSYRISERDGFHSLYAYVAEHHLVQQGTKIDEGVVQDETPLMLKDYGFSNLHVVGSYIHLQVGYTRVSSRLRDIGIEPQAGQGMDTASGGGKMIGYLVTAPKQKTDALKISGMTYARLTLLPPGKE